MKQTKNCAQLRPSVEPRQNALVNIISNFKHERRLENRATPRWSWQNRLQSIRRRLKQSSNQPEPRLLMIFLINSKQTRYKTTDFYRKSQMRRYKKTDESFYSLCNRQPSVAKYLSEYRGFRKNFLQRRQQRIFPGILEANLSTGATKKNFHLQTQK